MSFVVTPEQEQVIEQAVELASDGTPGRDRKARGLANLARDFLNGDPMKRALLKMREEARRLFLTGEITTNAEIAARLKVKPTRSAAGGGRKTGMASA